MDTKHRLFVAVLLIAACLTACHQPAPDAFRYHLLSAPGTLDPAGSFGTQGMGLIDRIFDGLTRLDRERGIAAPEIASEWKISEDGLTYAFVLREDVLFHHGRTLSAADVEYSWRRLLDPAVNSPNRWMLESIERIEILAPHRLRVRLHDPEPTFLLRLSNPATSIVPRESVEEFGDTFARRPIGSGPYRFHEWIGDLQVEVRAFEDHYSPPLQVQRILFEVVPSEKEALELFQQGRLDLVVRLPGSEISTLQREYPESVYAFPGLAWMGFCFRCDAPPFDDARIRRAISLAMERKSSAKSLGLPQKSASQGFLPSSVIAQDPQITVPETGYALEEARRLLAEAGFPHGEGFPSLTYVSATSERDRANAQTLIEGLRLLGISVEHQTLEATSLFDGIADRRFLIFRAGWIAEYPDPEPFLRPLFHSRGTYNYYGYSNPEVDRLLDATRDLPREERTATFREIEEILITDAPCVVLAHQNEIVLLRPGWAGIPFGFVSEALEIEQARWEIP